MFVHVRPKSGGALYINTDYIVMVERVNNKVRFANGESVFLTQEGYDDLMYGIWTYQTRADSSRIDCLCSENAKLRELVRDLRACNDSCPRCLELMGKCEYEESMRELGIEVD